jgi:hypothetical protein
LIAWGIVLAVVAIVVLAIRMYVQRAAAQRAAHEARVRAMAQTHLAAARKKKAAETAALSKHGGGAAESVPSLPSPRDERECPFCAETILKKAKVCKHCRRDVEPLA